MLVKFNLNLFLKIPKKIRVKLEVRIWLSLNSILKILPLGVQDDPRAHVWLRLPEQSEI